MMGAPVQTKKELQSSADRRPFLNALAHSHEWTFSQALWVKYLFNTFQTNDDLGTFQSPIVWKTICHQRKHFFLSTTMTLGTLVNSQFARLTEAQNAINWKILNDRTGMWQHTLVNLPDVMLHRNFSHNKIKIIIIRINDHVKCVH